MIYLDHNATTPVINEVLECMLPYFSQNFANPSSPHAAGAVAREAMEEARRKVAESIGASPSSIIFTSGGTEANNLAIKGVAHALRSKGKHIITQKTEHPSILEVLKHLEEEGFEVTYLDVDQHGVVHPLQVADAIRKDTVLISIMYANNETGTIQPIFEIAELAREMGVYFHTDAVQALGKLPLNMEELGVDLASFSAHKIYGPKGVGALYRREGVRLSPIIYGGGHEGGWRAGTENVAAIVGFGKAAELVPQLLKEMERIKDLRNRLERELLRMEDVRVNGHQERRLPNTLNVSFKGIEAEALVATLSKKGICVSSGSACSSKKGERSHTLAAMGLEASFAKGAIRISLGKDNVQAHIDSFVQRVKESVDYLRTPSVLS